MERKTLLKEALILFILSGLFLIVLSFLKTPKKLFLAVILMFSLSIAVLFIFLLNRISGWIGSKTKGELTKIIARTTLYSIPSIILIYVIYINAASYMTGGNSNYFIDIGSKEEENANDITALASLSQIGDKIEVTYRELKNSTVYFDVAMPENAKKMNFTIRFKDNFPKNAKGFYVGANNSKSRYEYKPLYFPEFYKIKNLTHITDNGTTLYMLNNSKQFSNISVFLDDVPHNSIIATDMDLEQKENRYDDYETGEINVTTAIRGSATMYTYAKYSLKLDVEKFDLNWNTGGDSLKIEVYNSKNELVGSTTIKDDGITADKNSSKIGKRQNGNLSIYPINEGVYKIQLKTSTDVIITKIKINQKKLVFEGNMLLANNRLYNLTSKSTSLYLKNNRKRFLTFVTSHKEGLQNVTINKKRFEINKIQQDFNYGLEPSKDFYEIKIPKNDLTIKTINYLSFSKDSYFEPYKYRIISMDSFDYIKNNANYILTDYQEPLKENGWITSSVVFDTTYLFIKDKKLNMVLNAKHLGDPNYADYFIPVDWIDVSVETKGILS